MCLPSNFYEVYACNENSEVMKFIKGELIQQMLQLLIINDMDAVHLNL